MTQEGVKDLPLKVPINHRFTPGKMNGWNLQITPFGKGISSEAKLHEEMFHVNLPVVYIKLHNLSYLSRKPHLLVTPPLYQNPRDPLQSKLLRVTRVQPMHGEKLSKVQNAMVIAMVVVRASA